MARNTWKWLEMAGMAAQLLNRAENDWKWLEMAGNGWNG